VVSAPVVSAPVVSAPVVSAPVVSAPVVSAPVVSAPVVMAPPRAESVAIARSARVAAVVRAPERATNGDPVPGAAIPASAEGAERSETEGAVRGGGASWTGGASRESDEQRESAMLGRAFATVASDPAAVLSTLAAYDREFAQGRMRDERDFLEVLALRGLGRLAQARGRAEAMLARAPRGMYAPRVRRMLEQLP
jgi:hypothetical protein